MCIHDYLHKPKMCIHDLKRPIWSTTYTTFVLNDKRYDFMSFVQRINKEHSRMDNATNDCTNHLMSIIKVTINNKIHEI